MTPQALKRAIANLIDDFCVLNKEVSELREHNRYLESRVSEVSDYSAILSRHTALVEAVAWERECQYVDAWMNRRPWSRGDAEIWASLAAARAEVDRLIANEAEPAE